MVGLWTWRWRTENSSPSPPVLHHQDGSRERPVSIDGEEEGEIVDNDEEEVEGESAQLAMLRSMVLSSMQQPPSPSPSPPSRSIAENRNLSSSSSSSSFVQRRSASPHHTDGNDPFGDYFSPSLHRRSRKASPTQHSSKWMRNNSQYSPPSPSPSHHNRPNQISSSSNDVLYHPPSDRPRNRSPPSLLPPIPSSTSARSVSKQAFPSADAFLSSLRPNPSQGRRKHNTKESSSFTARRFRSQSPSPPQSPPSSFPSSPRAEFSSSNGRIAAAGRCETVEEEGEIKTFPAAPPMTSKVSPPKRKKKRRGWVDHDVQTASVCVLFCDFSYLLLQFLLRFPFFHHVVDHVVVLLVVTTLTQPSAEAMDDFQRLLQQHAEKKRREEEEATRKAMEAIAELEREQKVRLCDNSFP